jgi:hypothetical protein
MKSGQSLLSCQQILARAAKPGIRAHLLLAPLAALLVFLSGCGCGGSELCGPAPKAQGFLCSERQIQQFVFDRMKEWYLFPESIPADASVDRFATAEELLA